MDFLTVSQGLRLPRALEEGLSPHRELVKPVMSGSDDMKLTCRLLSSSPSSTAVTSASSSVGWPLSKLVVGALIGKRSVQKE